MGKPEERGATEKEARNVLGPKGPEILEFLRDEPEPVNDNGTLMGIN